jgi:hypothetical protein
MNVVQMTRLIQPRPELMAGLLSRACRRAWCAALVAVPAWTWAAAPDLVCELRYASEMQMIRQPVSADPYLAMAQQVGQRFQFKAIVLGEPERIEHIAITVYDLSVDGAPVVIHQAHYEPPFNMHAELPALTGWNHVYSSVYGRELRYGCALQGGAAQPRQEQP